MIVLERRSDILGVRIRRRACKGTQDGIVQQRDGIVAARAHDANFVYWTGQVGSSLLRVPKTGVTATTVVPTANGEAIATDGVNVFWADDFGTISTAPVFGASPISVATGLVTPGATWLSTRTTCTG